MFLFNEKNYIYIFLNKLYLNIYNLYYDFVYSIYEKLLGKKIYKNYKHFLLILKIKLTWGFTGKILSTSLLYRGRKAEQHQQQPDINKKEILGNIYP